MAKQNTGEPTPETKVETTTPETEVTETVEDPDVELDDVGGDDEKKEQAPDYYEKQLTALRKEVDDKNELLAEKERQLEIKDRAIQASKKKAQPKVDLDETEALLDAKLEEKLAIREAQTLAKGLAKTPAESELILHHFHNSIVRTGDVEKDIRRALAVANEGRIDELLGRASAEEEGEERSLSTLGGGYSRPSTGKIKSQARKLAESVLPKEMHKHILIK